jgi:hypothetical protein
MGRPRSTAAMRARPTARRTSGLTEADHVDPLPTVQPDHRGAGLDASPAVRTDRTTILPDTLSAFAHADSSGARPHRGDSCPATRGIGGRKFTGHAPVRDPVTAAAVDALRFGDVQVRMVPGTDDGCGRPGGRVGALRGRDSHSCRPVTGRRLIDRSASGGARSPQGAILLRERSPVADGRDNGLVGPARRARTRSHCGAPIALK